MIIYRPHRGKLSQSIKEAKEFRNEQEMKEYIVEEWDNNFSVDDIVILEEYHDDDRIGWKNVRQVCSKRFGNTNNMELYGVAQCIGMCSTDYSKLS